MAQFLKKCLRYFIFSGLFSLFINTLYLTFPIYMLAIYVRVLTSYSFPTLYSVTILGLLALLVLGCLDFLRSRLLVQAGIEMDRLLSGNILEKMLKKAGSIDKDGYTEGLRDVNTLRNYFAGNAIFSFFDAPWVLIYLLIIYIMHPVLGYVAAGGAVILLVFGILQELLTREKVNQTQTLRDQEQGFVLKSIRNAEMLHSMGMLRNMAEHRNGLNDQELVLQDDSNKKSQVLQSMSKSFRLMMQVFIFGVGAYLVLQTESNAGIIIAASIIMGRALAPVDQFMGSWRQTMEAKGAYKRLDDLIKTSPPREVRKVESPKGRLAVEDVSLELNEVKVLQNVSFILSPGQIMGLIGPNGAGKTSLARIALGIWKPTQGSVLLDEVAIDAWDYEQLSSTVGYLPQDVELFPGTISENIARMGEVDGSEVVRASQKAGVHKVILRLPKGYKTDINELGGNLSGGQRQRIGLARALYGDPKLVILDEPNSNLDEQGERALMDTLLHLKNNGLAILMITHKPSLLSKADRILMLRQGQVVLLDSSAKVLSHLMHQKTQPPPGQVGQA
jgi:PrtD family type I secretion system ABC transporter